MMDFQWVAESAPLPGFVIRATVVLATGIALAWLMRDRSAQVRHRLWTATLLLLLLLPALTFWAPRWKMPLLPVATRPVDVADATRLQDTSPAEFAAASVSGAAATTAPPSATPLMASESSDLGDKAAAIAAVREVVAGPALGADPEPASAPNAEFEYGSAPATGPASKPVALRGGGPIAPSSPSSPRAQLLLLWAIGCLAVLVSLAVGHLRFRTLVRRAHPIEDPGGPVTCELSYPGWASAGTCGCS